MQLFLFHLSTLLASALLACASSQLPKPNQKPIILPLKRFGTLKQRYISPGHRLALLQQRTAQDATKFSNNLKKTIDTTVKALLPKLSSSNSNLKNSINSDTKRFVKVRARSATVQMQAGTND